MTNETNFDDLAKKANESGGAMEDLNKLFGAVFALDEWIFIARGELPNVSPYVASNAGYANGQQMIRAFTDSDRLLRFAKENNLTKPDGSVLELTVPTKGIVEYLEQFIANGVGGIWFNSDTKSDGFFIPLKQLRPIKEHLEKLNLPQATVQNSNFETVIIIINDGLMLPSGFVKKSDYTCNLYCLVPRDWTDGEKLKENYLEKFFEKMYGATWRGGNSDGSRYVVENSFSQILTDENLNGANWTTSQNTAQNHFWFYVAGENGEIKSVKPPEFQKEFEASRQSRSAQVPPASNLENWGLGHASGGDVDLRIKFFEPGMINSNASILPFIAAIQPLVRDYQGAGDFAFIFNFVPEAMRELDERFMNNDHGQFLRVRRFKYVPPNQGANADATTADSSELRHVQTGATLKISFAMLQVARQQSAAFYYGFEGNRSEVVKLINAVKPALNAAGFVAEEKKT